MASVNLQVPTLVSNLHIEEKEHYVLRALFTAYPTAVNQRYEQAVSHYKKEIRQLFKGYNLKREEAEQLLWFLFNPEIKYHQFHFQFHLHRQFISGRFAAASFRLKGHTFVCLPQLDNFMFLQEERAGNSLEQSCRRVVKSLLEEYQKQEQGAFDANRFQASEKSFVTTIETIVNVGHEPFAFDAPANNWFFSTLMADTTFDGAAEVEIAGEDLNARYPSELDRAYHREEMVSQLYQLLFHPVNSPIALIGPKGVGKHALLQEVIWRYESAYYGAVKGRKQHIWKLDPTRVIAGMSVVGMWQKRMEAIIAYLRKPSDTEKSSDMLMVDNPVALLRIGKSAQNNMTLADLLRPYLEKRQLQLLVLARPEEWKAMQEKDRRFSSLFRLIRLQPPDIDLAIKIILEKRRKLERENDTIIKVQAIQQLLDLQRNYLRSQPLPGSVLRLLEQLAVKHRSGTVDAPEVREAFKAFSGLQEQIFDAPPAETEDAIAEQIGQELVGQPEAVQALANVVHLLKAKLTDPGRPLSSFLFVGPTGVGKTQAAKVLCRHLMGDEDQLLRFDMNEYIDSSSVSRLIGDDFSPEGQLTGAVRYRPFGILLLDEIEKAHPLVHDLLLQLLDDGRLTDSLGRTIDFTNTIIIMTSNVGAREANSSLGFQPAEEGQPQAYRRAMEQFFRPEFLNRIDQTVVFHALQPEHILAIARLQIKELLQRDGFVRRATILNISQAALEWVAQRGFDARMGGRALKRQIEKDLTALSAEQLLDTHTDRPILLDIFLRSGALRPRIRPMEFVQPLSEGWLPEMPDETKGKWFYVQLLRVLENIKEALDQYEAQEEAQDTPLVFSDAAPDRQLGWEYYHYKAKVEEEKEAIRNISLGFRDRYYKIGPAIPYRLKAVDLVARSDISTKGVRENIKDKLFQQEGLTEISDAYQYANVQFDSLKTEFINYFLKVAFLQLQLEGLEKQGQQTARIQISSLIAGLGEEAAAFLIEQYQGLLQLLDLSHQAYPEEQYIEVKAYGIRELLQGEAGIHLFYSAHRNPLPIRVQLNTGAGEASDLEALRVVRIYNNWQTLTDLRTGFSNAMNMTSSEFALLVYAGIEPEQRAALNPF